MEIQGALAIELNAIARRFGRRWALRGIDLRVGRGETVAITGRNGSGKTTLLRICATLLRPTRGAGQVFGLDLIGQAPAIRSTIGFLAHSAGLYEDLTADENLRFAARMMGLPDARQATSAALERTGLRQEAAERVRGFSSGMRRR
ncbi:MAG: ATP-binding cassette domain-containing protein, partial [Longimicrobiales bacterium]